MKAISTSLLSIRSSWVGILIFVVVTGLSAHIRIPLPFTPVPITLQSIFVLLSGAILGARAGMTSQALVIFLAACGAPFIASPFLFSPTSGYLIGFIFASGITGLAVKALKPSSFLSIFLLITLSSAALFYPGVIWLKYFLNISWSNALAFGLYPFVFGDIVKCMITAILYQRLSKRN